MLHCFALLRDYPIVLPVQAGQFVHPTLLGEYVLVCWGIIMIRFSARLGTNQDALDFIIMLLQNSFVILTQLELQ